MVPAYLQRTTLLHEGRAVRSVTARKGRDPVGRTASHSRGQRFKS